MENNQRLAIILSMVVVTAWLFWENNAAEQRKAELSALDAAHQEQTYPEEDAIVGDDASRVDPARDGTRSGTRGVEPYAEAAGAGSAGGDAGTARELAADRDVRTATDPALWEGVIRGSHYEAKLSNEGAALTHWTLLDYTSTALKGKEPIPIELVTPGISGVAPTTPFLELGFGDLRRAVYEVESVEPDRVVFAWTRGDVTIRKTYSFDLTGYDFDLEIEVRNGSDRSLASTFEVVWPSSQLVGNDYMEDSVVVLSADSVEREPLASVGQPGFLGGFFSGLFGGGEDGPKVWRDVKWAGADLKYFASLLLPEKPAEALVTFASIDPGKTAAAVIATASQQIAPGTAFAQRFTAYLGPKDPAILETYGRDLNRSINLGYSWLEPLTLFFHWLLNAFYSVIPNYGWSIILITIMVRVATLPIMNRQMRSMERMRALQPKLKEIQAKFSDDRQKQSEATMALYKESGVNPLGGCLPMLLQFPVFIGLFYALQSSFSLRQAPFIAWITDLSAPEALFVLPFIDLPFRLLPVIMGASMILQQKLTPTTVDPSQQMMMMFIMPVMMTVLFYQFPSGLVLYWMISNFLGIGHQMLVGRRMKAAGEA